MKAPWSGMMSPRRMNWADPRRLVLHTCTTRAGSPPLRWTVKPATLQLPLAEKLTAKLEEAVALTAKSGSPKILLDNAANVIVWLLLATEKDCGTSTAGL